MKRPLTTTKVNPSGKGKSTPIRTTRIARSRSASSPCMISERAKRSYSPASGMTGTRYTVCMRFSRHQRCSREFPLRFLFLSLSHIYPHSSPCPFAPNSNANLAYSPDFTSTSTSTSNIHPNLNPTYDLDPPSPQRIQYLRLHMTNHAPRSFLDFHHRRLRSPRKGLRADPDGRIRRRARRILIDVDWLTAIRSQIGSRKTGGRWIASGSGG